MPESLTLTVTGMKCGGCETAVTEKLFADEGVIAVTASRLNNSVEVEFEKSLTNPNRIKEIIQSAGYKVE